MALRLKQNIEACVPNVTNSDEQSKSDSSDRLEDDEVNAFADLEPIKAPIIRKREWKSLSKNFLERMEM